MINLLHLSDLHFAKDWNGEKMQANPPGSQYGLVLQELVLLNKRELAEHRNNPRPEIE